MRIFRNIAVYCGATLPRDEVYIEAARHLGECLAARGIGLVFGGSNEGTMRIIAEACLERGGAVTGVFPSELPESMLMPGLTRVIRANGLAARKAQMLANCDAVIALAGSYGTWDELFDALAQRKIPHGAVSQPIGVLNTAGFYDQLLAFIEHSYAAGFTSSAFRHLLISAATPEELLTALANAPEIPHLAFDNPSPVIEADDYAH